MDRKLKLHCHFCYALPSFRAVREADLVSYKYRTPCRNMLCLSQQTVLLCVLPGSQDDIRVQSLYRPPLFQWVCKQLLEPVRVFTYLDDLILMAG